MVKKTKSTKKSANNIIKQDNNVSKTLKKYSTRHLSQMKNVIKTFTKFYNTLDIRYIMAIAYYKGEGSRFLNEFLYSGKIPKKYLNVPYDDDMKHSYGKSVGEYKPSYYNIPLSKVEDYVRDGLEKRLTFVNTLDKIFNMDDVPKLTGDEVLYRGVNSNDNLYKLRKNQTFTMKNFISTSLSRELSEDYAMYPNEKSVLFIIKNCKDVPYLYIPNNNFLKKHKKLENLKITRDFAEHLLPRNIQFKIVEVINKKSNQFDYYKKFINLKKYKNDNNSYEDLYLPVRIVICEYVKTLETTPIEPEKIVKRIKKLSIEMSDTTDDDNNTDEKNNNNNNNNNNKIGKNGKTNKN